MVEDVRATARRGAADDVVSSLERAVEALELDQPDEAARLATQAKRLAPRSAAAREVLGLAHYRAGRHREALSELQAYRRISGRADQNHVIADCQRAVGAPEKAVPLAEEALASSAGPEVKAEAVVVAASALADLERWDEALSLIRRYPTDPASARPHDLRVWYVAGDILERAGRPREAAREFGRVVAYDAEAFDAAERLARLS